MEATENDLPASVPFRVSGFPTIKFKKAGTKDFIDYEGDRTLEGFMAFIEENAVNKLDVPVKTENETVAEPEAVPVGGQEPLKAAEPDSHHDEL